MVSAKRHPFQIAYRTGLTKEGKIIASECRIIGDGGAYAQSSPGVMVKAAVLANGPYKIDNVHVDSIAVYTNTTPSGAMRGFGATQLHFATETHMDTIAERLGMDPLQFRLLNALRDGHQTHTNQTVPSVSLARTTEGAAKAAGWEPHVPGSMTKKRAGTVEDSAVKKRGVGVACNWYGIARTATIDRAGAWAELDDGGTGKVAVGVTEIGEGILTLLAQVAAEELGVRPEDITLSDNDTARAPEAAHAGATRQTYMCGNAVALACRDVRQRLDAVMAAHWKVDLDQIEARAGQIWCKSNPDQKMSMAQAVHLCKSRGVVPVGSGSFMSRGQPLDPETGRADVWQTYVFGTQIAEVEVDTGTGEVRVIKVTAAHDVGRAINPQGVQGQIEGGVVMGLGYALMEEFLLEQGVTKTPGFSKYILPTSLDIPEIESVIIEDPDPTSPLKAKGIGEPSMLATAPAIINAIYDAVGVRITQLPASPERVLAALREKAARESAAHAEH